MKPTVSLGRWFGVPVGLHYSWFLIAGLIAVSLAGQFAALNPGWSPSTVWALAVLTALLFFLSIVLHELSHAMVARASNVPVRGITLFALGGVARIERDAATAGKEFAIAIAGPAASVAIGLICRLAVGPLALASGSAPSPFAAVFGWLGYINIALALFNLVPGFPLDGGRVLRAIAWAVTGSVDRATRIAARTGMAFAFMFVLVGLFRVITRSDFGGLWLALIGWFLLDAAQAQYAATVATSKLSGIRVADLMADDCPPVDASMTIRQFVDEQLLRAPDRCYAVRRGGDVVGFIAPVDVKAVDRAMWSERTVGDLVPPLDATNVVPPEAPAVEALTIMGRQHIDQVPVVTSGHVEGVVTRANLMRVLQARMELT